MSQATLERPVAGTAKRAPRQTLARAMDPKDKIMLQFSDLQAGIAAMVEKDEGDRVGRVLAHAGTIVRNALECFATGDESDAAASYDEMMDADSFVDAASALAAQDFNVSGRGYNGRTTAAETLVQQSTNLCDAIDRYRMGLARPQDHDAPASQRPAEKDAQPVTGDDAEERHQLVLDATYQIETLVALLLDCSRRVDADTTYLHLPMVVKALGTRIEHLNIAILDAVGANSGAHIAEIAAQVNGTSDELVQRHPQSLAS